MKFSKNFFASFENQNCQLSIAIELLIIYNCRASEVLSATWQNFYPGQFLILEGKKKSRNIIVRDRMILSKIDSLPRLDKSLIFPSLTYSILYHFCKKNFSHLFNRFKKKKKCLVTHGWRYLNVSKFDNDKIIRDILHHSSLKSGQYYKNNKGEKTNGCN